jgi:hypothetical protein
LARGAAEEEVDRPRRVRRTGDRASPLPKIDPPLLARIGPPVDSVERLVSLLRESWSTIEGHTPMVEADLDRAVVQAKRFSAAVAARENNANRAPALETRLRVVSRLIRLYDALLRMVTYVRWRQDDVDQFVPSLWATRGRRARTQRGIDPNVDDPAVDPVVDPVIDAGEPQTPAGPVPNNGGAPFTA